MTPAVIAGVVAYSWWATGLAPFTWPSLLATMGGGLTAVAVAVTVGSRLERSPPSLRRSKGNGIWAAVLAAVAAWELAAYVQHPRSDHPTLSSLAGAVLQNHPTRAAAFIAWLALGVYLARP